MNQFGRGRGGEESEMREGRGSAKVVHWDYQMSYLLSYRDWEEEEAVIQVVLRFRIRRVGKPTSL